MTCAGWEERVALFAGGDLGTAEAAAVERHLGDCAECRALAAGLRAGLDGLREVHAEQLAAAHYAAVRGRVLVALANAQQRRVVWPWAWAAALAVAAGAVVVWVVKPSTVPAPELPRMVATAPVVDRPALGQSRGDRSLTVAAPRGRVVRRAAPARAERAVPPEMELPELAATEIAPPAPPAAQAEDPPLRMVQLATADPNVVIYWLLEDRGERR